MEVIAECHTVVEACECSQMLVILHECHRADLGPVAAGTAAAWDNTGLAVAWGISVILFLSSVN